MCRGGGLLKYCNLLVKNYRPAWPEAVKTMERYMCSRFIHHHFDNRGLMSFGCHLFWEQIQMRYMLLVSIIHSLCRNDFAIELVAVIQEECPDALKIVAMCNFEFVSVEVYLEHIL